MRTYNAKFNKALKDADGQPTVKGWVIPVAKRASFMEGLNRREGLSSNHAAHQAHQLQEPLLPAPVQVQAAKIKGTLRSKQWRVKQEASPDEFTESLDLLEGSVAGLVTEDFRERCIDDKIYLSAKSSTFLSSKVETYGEAWDVLLWAETTAGALAILRKA